VQPEQLIVDPDTDTPLGADPSDQLETPVPVRRTVPVPLLAPRPETRSGSSVTALADTAVSVYDVAFAGNAARPAARALPSTTGTPIPSAVLSLIRKASPRFV
jgi:hypothetical protein